MTVPSKAVFLSYASEDAEAAKRICEALRAARIEVWFDKSELRSGDAWDRRIRNQIHDCALFVPIISAYSDGRTEGYFRLEWKLAVDRSHLMADDATFLLPVVIDDTPDATARVPDRFREVQWTRLPAGETPPAFVERVLRLLSSEIAHAQAAVSIPAAAALHAAAAPRHPARNPATSRQTQRVLLVIAAVAVIGVGYVAADRFVLSKRSAATTQTSASTGSGASPAQNAIPEKSIAVLPFADMSEKHDQEYFADGLVDELLDVLARVPGLRVIARTSSFQFKDKTSDLREVGARLGAAHLVEGSVRRNGDRVRVTAQLIRAQDGSHEWSGTFDQSVGDLFQLQSDLALSLGRALQLSVVPDLWGGRGHSTNADVYDLFLRGVHAFDRYTVDGYRDAEANFERAVALDPKFFRAREALALSHQVMAANAWVPPDAGWARVRSDASELLADDPHDAMAHLLLARFHTLYSWDWSQAQREVAAALAAGPRNWVVLFTAGDLALALGELPKAEQLFKEALLTDPLSADAHYELGVLLMALGRVAEADDHLRQCLAITPTYEGGYESLGEVRLLQGRRAEALNLMLKETNPGIREASLPMAYAALGRMVEAKAAIARAEQVYGGTQASPIAMTHFNMGNLGQGFVWLDRAIGDKSPFLVYLQASMKSYPKAAADPRYADLLRKMKLPE